MGRSAKNDERQTMRERESDRERESGGGAGDGDKEEKSQDGPTGRLGSPSLPPSPPPRLNAGGAAPQTARAFPWDPPPRHSAAMHKRAGTEGRSSKLSL